MSYRKKKKKKEQCLVKYNLNNIFCLMPDQIEELIDIINKKSKHIIIRN